MLREWKGKLHTERKHLQITNPTEERYLEYISISQSVIARKQVNLKKQNQAKVLKKHFTGEDTQMTNKHKKRFLSIFAAAAAAKSLQSCPTLRDPIDGSPAGSSVHGSF